MIDIAAEEVLSLAQAARRLPRRRLERPVSPSTLWRWHRKGVRGVHLEAIRLPSGLVTSVQALQRFVDALNQPATSGHQSSLHQSQAAAAAESELRAAGILDPDANSNRRG